MTPWKCIGCGCEYEWNEPNTKDGSNFCDICVEDPEAIKKSKTTPPINSGWWFAAGILVGMVVSKFLFCNN